MPGEESLWVLVMRRAEAVVAPPGEGSEFCLLHRVCQEVRIAITVHKGALLPVLNFSSPNFNFSCHVI